MAEIIAGATSRSCAEVVSRDEAEQIFADQRFKLEHVRRAARRRRRSSSRYAIGDFADLCRGPHMPSAGKIGAFKLMKVAGAYWKRRRRSRDAHPPLRHRVLQEGGT